MKEQGKDFDPSKEPVTGITIRAIGGECHKIFLKKISPGTSGISTIQSGMSLYGDKSYFDRQGLTSEGKSVYILNHYLGINSDSKETAEKYRLAPHASGENYFVARYGMLFTEIFNVANKEKVTLKKYRSSAKYPEKSGKFQVLQYLYVVDADANFLQLYICKTKEVFGSEETLPIAEKESQELLSQGFSIDRVIFDVGSWSPRNATPISNAVKPNESHAQTLLESLRRIKRIGPIRLDDPLWGAF